MDTRLLRMVNCESCDHLLYLTDREGHLRAMTCESDFDIDICGKYPLHEMQCHSLYELWEEVREDGD